MSTRKEAITRYVQRPDAYRLDVGISAEAAQSLKKLAAFGVSGDFPEVEPFYASRLLEQALAMLGDDPVEGIQTMPAQLSNPPKVGDSAPDATVLGVDGESVLLSDQWIDQRALLVFLRHYG